MALLPYEHQDSGQRQEARRIAAEARDVPGEPAPRGELSAADRLRSARTYRILSLDGGGIYGLTTALWLKMLCLADDKFLSEEDVKNKDSPLVFAGLSAGSLMALVLAKARSPREAILNGELERLWTEPIGAFSNRLDPITAWRSLFLKGGWAGEQDFLHQLTRLFGQMTMKDLYHPAFVSAFSWTGETVPVFPDRNDFVSRWFPFRPWWLAGLSPGHRGSHPLERLWHSAFSPENLVEDQGQRWGPKFFSSHEDDHSSCSLPVVEVAYGCSTPPGARATRGGIADAAVYTPNPSANALAGIFQMISFAHGRSMNAGNMLNSIHLLSVGNGFATPYYWLRNNDLSFSQTSRTPTNPLRGRFFSPISSAPFDGDIENANILCEQLLTSPAGRAYEEAEPPLDWNQPPSRLVLSRYFRLSPRVLPIPAPTASLLSRFPSFKEFFVQQIYQAVVSQHSIDEVKRANAFIKPPRKGTPWTALTRI